jgi:uncharacterized protein (TIGR02001 family)
MHYRSSVPLCAILLGLAAASEPVQAGVTGTAALTSDYVFRGVSQTGGDPALQAGFESAAESGWYAGLWGSNVSWLSDLSTSAAPISSSVEIDAYGGFRGRFSEALGFDAGAIFYGYPGDFPAGFNEADTLELYFGLSWDIWGLKVSYAPTDLFGYPDSDGSQYLELNANWPLTSTWTLNAHAGHQWIESNDAFDYTDWKLGLTWAWVDGFSVAAAYVDTNAEDALYTNPFGTRVADATVMLTLTKAF